MPRKKKTIDDFTFSLEHTKKIDTSHRPKTKLQSSRLNIDLSSNIIKHYHLVSIHCKSISTMKEFLSILGSFANINTLYLKYKYQKLTLALNADIEWYQMPEFTMNKELLDSCMITLYIEVTNDYNYITFINEFYNHFSVILWNQLSYMWYPQRISSLYKDKMFISLVEHQPRYPIYIVSKGRWEKRYTSKYLDWININYKMIIEPDEYEYYAKVIDITKLVVLPQCYLDLHQGSIPARNFVWKHAKETGAKRHWILDDNITSWRRFIDSEKVYVRSGLVFKVVEDYVDRYDNIKMAGHHYTMFGVSTNTNNQPITMNTRIYSSILLSNDLFPDFTWRGKYNEDTDLSLRILKNGYPTVLFNCILADKLKTQSQKGGNTDSIYAEENGIYQKTASLIDQHPDVTKMVKKFGRIHHQVDYSSFKQLTPNKITGITLREEYYNYDMILVDKNVNDLYIN